MRSLEKAFGSEVVALKAVHDLDAAVQKLGAILKVEDILELKQIRLQPEINEALDAPVISPQTFARNLLNVLRPGGGWIDDDDQPSPSQPAAFG
jgi:hypothetical protein